MKDKVTIKTGASLPILGLLGAVLVVLKALGLITLSWLWVLAPFWIPIAGFMIALVLILLALAVAKAVQRD